VPPSLALAGVWLDVRPVHGKGLPVLHRSSSLTCHRHYPGGSAGCVHRSLPQPWQPSPRLWSGRPPH